MPSDDWLTYSEGNFSKVATLASRPHDSLSLVHLLGRLARDDDDDDDDEIARGSEREANRARPLVAADKRSRDIQ